MNNPKVEQAVAALVNHYVAASAGLVSENVKACYGYQKMAILFASEVEGDSNLPSRNIDKGKRSGKSKKGKVCSKEAFVSIDSNTSEPLNSFFNFVREHMAAVSPEDVSASASGNIQVSTGLKLKEMWAALSEEAKGKYSTEYVAKSLFLLYI
jgi:hypothetical protein